MARERSLYRLGMCDRTGIVGNHQNISIENRYRIIHYLKVHTGTLFTDSRDSSIYRRGKRTQPDDTVNRRIKELQQTDNTKYTLFILGLSGYVCTCTERKERKRTEQR